MVKKIIQVPINDDLLKDLNKLSKKQKKSRAEVIREACAQYVAKVREEELDRQYIEGYTRFPEEPWVGEVGAYLLAEKAKEEPW